MPKKTWDVETEATLCRMWQNGKTGSDIADAVGRTRCAVLGKLNRMGLIGDCTKIARRVRKARAHKARAHARALRSMKKLWASRSPAERAAIGRLIISAFYHERNGDR